ncbi:MAG TPA: DUF4124 domain-containing protein [Burkholderiales bacterium]|nr:DUF4124 domain-containing protein [Burkholderiales bacterium]
MHRFWAPLLVGAFLALPAHAQTGPNGGSVTEIWKCRSADGRWTYTNDRREAEKQKCEVVTRQVNIAPLPPQRPPAARPGGFPRESAAERERRSSNSREILEKELATEEQALAKARQDLAAQEEVRYGNERNYERVLERLQPYKDSVETHEKNIEALKRELGNLR